MLDVYVPEALRPIVEGEIRNDERIVWSAQPILRRYITRGLPLFFFSIFFLGFAIAWTTMAFHASTASGGDTISTVFPLFGLPFLLIGTGMFLSPLFYLYQGKNTFYVITTRRAILFQRGFKVTVKSFYRNHLQDLRREQYRDGAGSLILEQKISVNSRGYRTPIDSGFFCVPDVKIAEDFLRRISDEG